MERKFIQILMAIAISLTVAGCANGYKDFYTAVPQATPEAIAASRISPAPVTPMVERSQFGDLEQILLPYLKRGYVAIGSSMFNSGESVSETAAIDQGRAVGADLVLIFTPRFTNSVTSSVPITTPTTNTSYTTGSATAYGPGGPVSAYGNASTTTYGSNTTYIPVTVNRSDYGAIYFVKLRIRIGAFVRNLNDNERQALQTNQGVVVLTIVDDSPAYLADVLPGDIIVSIDGERISNQEGFTRAVESRKGRSVKVALLRQGRSLEKNVQLGI